MQTWRQLDRDTQVADLGPLRVLTSLTALECRHTAVEDLEPLAGLTGLELLRVNNTRATSLSPLRELHALREPTSPVPPSAT